jgi:hypothetical protein
MTYSGGKTMTGNPVNDGKRHENRWRVAAWSTAAIILLLPLLAMQVTGEVNWTASDFIFAGILILSVGIPLELAVRKTSNTAYRAAAGLALAGAFLLVWVNAAVGITDSEADAWYLVAIAVGIVGALVAHFRPAGMAWAMVTVALAVAMVGMIALATGVVPAHNSAFRILAITAFLAALFVGSALLFREAARERPPAGAGLED